MIAPVSGQTPNPGHEQRLNNAERPFELTFFGRTVVFSQLSERFVVDFLTSGIVSGTLLSAAYNYGFMNYMHEQIISEVGDGVVGNLAGIIAGLGLGGSICITGEIVCRCVEHLRVKYRHMASADAPAPLESPPHVAADHAKLE